MLGEYFELGLKIELYIPKLMASALTYLPFARETKTFRFIGVKNILL